MSSHTVPKGLLGLARMGREKEGTALSNEMPGVRALGGLEAQAKGAPMNHATQVKDEK